MVSVGDFRGESDSTEPIALVHFWQVGVVSDSCRFPVLRQDKGFELVVVDLAKDPLAAGPL